MTAQFARELPELHAFVTQLAADYAAGEIADWRGFIERVHAFYTPDMMAKIERVAPGWKQMASFAHKQTLIHVTSVLVSLPQRAEFKALTPAQQNLAWWIVLFHDIAKEAHADRRDYVHGFVSAAVAAEALCKLDFGISLDSDEGFYRWADMTRTAIVRSEAIGELVQDNSQLLAIIDGMTALFGDDTPATLVLKGVLLHMSLTVVPALPQQSPLTDSEIKRYITPDLFPLLRVMLIVDSDGWALFEPERKADEAASARETFEHVAGLIGVTA